MTNSSDAYSPDAGVSSDVLSRELAIEQAHVDAVYERLGVATKSARSAAESGQELYRSDRGSWVREEDGTALFERDAFAFQAAKRLAILDAEHEGLVFGRLDHTAVSYTHLDVYKRQVHLVRRETLENEYERLPYEPLTQDVLGVPVLKVVIQVVAGRNIAVLVEAAVRNTILNLRGIDTYQEFVERHRRAMERSAD